MPILVMCSNPSCSELFDAPDEAVGKKVRCPTCGAVQDALPNRAAAVQQAPSAPPPAPAVPAPVTPPTAAPAAPIAPAPPAGKPAPGGEFVLEDARSSAGPAKAEPKTASPAGDHGVIDLVPLEGRASKDPAPAAPPPPAVGPISAGKSEGAARGPADKPAGAFKASAPKKVGDSDTKPPAEFELSAAVEETPDQFFKRPASNGAAKKTAAPSPESEIKFSALLDEPAPLQEEGASSDAPTHAVSDGVLENKWAELLIFVLGLIGMAAGLAMGLLYLDINIVANAYLGALLGWVAGFTLAFLIVLAADKSELPKAQCPVCRNMFPAETETCQWCGSPLSVPTFNPLATDCLAAGGYATTNIGSMIWMSLLLAFVATVLELFRLLPDLMPQASQAAPAFVVVGAIVGLAILAYLLQMLLTVIAETVSRSRSAPDLPNFFSVRNVVDFGKFAAISVLYIVPVFTLPLMPLGVLALAKPGNVSPFNLRGMSRVLGSHAKDFVILWLLLLMWGAGFVLSGAVLAVAIISVGDWVPQLEGSAGLAIHLIGTFFGTLVAAGIFCIFSQALCRCIGMFGRHNANILFPARDQGADKQSSDQPAAEKH